jgi:hypothetical protein
VKRFAAVVLALIALFACDQAASNNIKYYSPPDSSITNAFPITFTRLMSPVHAGGTGRLEIKTEPYAECEIIVEYMSGPSEAEGLTPKTADSSGRVTWVWAIGTRTTPGEWPVTVKATFNGFTSTHTETFEVRG